MDESKNKGRLRYFDPNTTVLENREGTNSDSITFPYEDYNIAVDLQIRVYNRYSCGFGDMTGEMQVFEYSTQNGTISFLGGTNGMLTTNYTDIQMINPSGNTTECLGIESIQVSYDSWLHPTVNIVFIDVKGATVMQPAESHYYNEHEKGNTYQIYKSLFSFPYPLFLLKVKGFYGRGVTYRLAVSKTDIEFDASSGSFKISVDFIGHIYGLFADIPMTYIAVAPYMEEGDRYWMQKVNEKKFWFYKMRDDGTLEEQCPMLKFPELTLRAAEVAYSQPVAKSNADSELAMQTLDEEVASLNSIMESYKNIINNASTFYFCEDRSFPNASYLFYTGPSEIRKDETISAATESFRNAIKEHDKAYNTIYESKFEELCKLILDDRFDGIECEILDDGSIKYKSDGDYSDGPDRFLKNNPYFEDIAKNKIKMGDVNLKRFKVYFLPKNGNDFNKIVNEEIPGSIKKIQESKGQVEKEFKDKQNALIEEALGFKPSIKNMYDLAFAHLDTFMYVYYETLKNIRKQLEMKKDERKKITYSITDEYTDTEKATGPGYNGFVRGAYLPPYTGFYKDTIDAADNYTKKKTMMWPGDLPNGDRKLEEVKFVFDLLSGAKLYFDRSEEVNLAIDKFRASGSTGAISGKHPLTDVKRFIPVTIYDIANNGYVANPYLSLASKIKNESDINEIVGDFYGIFSLRLFYYINSFSFRDQEDTRYFGRIEAINFFKAVGKNETKALREFITKFAEGESENADKKQFREIITHTGGISANFNGKNTLPVKSWRIDGSSNTNKSLFTKSGGKYIYSYSKENTVGGNATFPIKFKYFPIKVTSMADLKDDFSNGYPLYQEGYISSVAHKAYSGTTDGFGEGRTLKGGTFMLYETRDYISTLYNNIEEELSQEKSDNTNTLTDQKYVDGYRTGKTANGLFANFDKDFTVQVRKSCIEKLDGAETDIGRKESISVGSIDEQSQFIIKYPDTLDEFRSKSQADVNGNFVVDEADSLLECPLYWLQNNDYAKAYLFIQAAPLVNGETEKEKLLGMDYGTNKIIQKGPLLREGAFYWWHDNYDKVVTEGHCSFNISLSKTGAYETVSGDFKYKRPAHDETFISNFSNGVLADTSLDYYDNFETINPMPYNSSCSYYKIPYYETFFSESTKEVSSSRVEYLKQYFENWVENEFIPIARIYEDLKMYGSFDSDKRKYSDGINVGLLTGAITSGESNLIPNARKLQDFFRSLFFGVCTVFDYYGGFYSKENMTATDTAFDKGLRGFMDQLHEIYGDLEDATTAEANEAFAQAYADDPFRNKDLRLSTYMTLKSLYDKWICNSLKGDKTYRFNRTEDAKKQPGTYELDNFIYVDNFYRDIGYELTINLTKFVEWMGKCLPTSEMYTVEGIMSYNGRTLYEFLTDIAQDCGAILLAIPQRFMYDCGDNIKTVFTPIPSCEQWDDDTYTYMFLYTYKPSEHLGDQGTSNMDMNGWSPEGDGYDLTDEDIVGSLFDDNEIGYAVPAFGVTFAKENQAYFKNISLSTKQHGVTEAGLNATMQIATKASETIRETTLYGQDIYKVFANNSYECTVEMMGDMQIFPPMYFQLNNIPMWKGAYLIKKVTHNIKPGDVTTTIVGVRQNKYLIPMVDGTIVSLGTNENRAAANNDAPGGDGGGGGVTDLTVENVGGGEDYNVAGDRSKLIAEQQGLSEDITPTKPVIILTPGHSTGKKPQEHSWATRLIKNYIIPRLKQQHFKDGSSYADHVVQGGKKNKENMESSSYDFGPVRNLVEKYGSKCVVSINVHWNASHGKYFAAFWAHKTAGGGVKMRNDSQKFGLYFREAYKEVVAKKDTYSKMPIGMMDDGVPTWHYALKADNTDPGAGWSDKPTHCACVLTENFFTDYYPSTKKVECYSANWNEIDPATGRYCCGRGWLESEEGCNVIANAHVNAIVNYINSLGEDASLGGGAPSAQSAPTGGDGSKTNVGLVAYCRAQVGRPYWYGCIGQISSREVYNDRSAHFPSHYSASNFPSQYGKKVHDCIGLVKGYMWTNGPDDGNVKYQAQGFKDGNADAIYARQTRKGRMSEIPAVPGLLVHAPGHAGVYDGAGYILQAANHDRGVIKTPVTQGGWGWDGWAYIDEITYV